MDRNCRVVITAAKSNAPKHLIVCRINSCPTDSKHGISMAHRAHVISAAYCMLLHPSDARHQGYQREFCRLLLDGKHSTSCEYETIACCSPTVAASESARTEMMACGFLDSKATAGHSWPEEITPAQRSGMTLSGQLPGAGVVESRHMKGNLRAAITVRDCAVHARLCMRATRLSLWHARKLLR